MKKENIHIALDTAGVGSGNYKDILRWVDLILLDIKRVYVNYEHFFYVSLTYYDLGNQNKSTRNAIDDL